MSSSLSERLRAAVDALPLTSGMRVLEVGCGPGAAARAVTARIGDGHVHAIDRSARAIAQAVAAAQAEINAGRLSFEQVAVEDFELVAGAAPYDLAFAVRVGALDGRHPDLEQRAFQRLASALTPAGRLFVSVDEQMTEVFLAR